MHADGEPHLSPSDEGRQTALQRKLKNAITELADSRLPGTSPVARAMAATQKLPSDVIGLWLVDNRCGHDVAGHKEIDGIKHLVRCTEQMLTLCMTSGDSPTAHVIDMTLKELDVDISSIYQRESAYNAISWFQIHGYGVRIYEA